MANAQPPVSGYVPWPRGPAPSVPIRVPRVLEVAMSWRLWQTGGSGWGFPSPEPFGGFLVSAMAAEGGGGGGGRPDVPPVDLSDQDLVQLVLDGDTTAYRGLVERYQGRVYALVYGMVRNREDARDIVQEAFVKAYRNLRTYRREASFHAWLFRIAMNLAIDQIRSKIRHPQGEFDEKIDQREAGSEYAVDHLRRHPGRDLERQRLYERIMNAMQQLPVDQRQVVLLREIEGLSYKEIADTMDIPEGTVMSRLFYARKKLQDLLKDER